MKLAATDHNACYVEVYFNGTKCIDVVRLDDVENWVEVHARDRGGNLVVSENKIQTIRRYGRVKVIEDPEHPLEQTRRPTR